jgi:hypothetical protein
MELVYGGSERPAVALPPPVMATEAVETQTAVHPGGEGSCGAAGDHHREEDSEDGCGGDEGNRWSIW